MGAPSTQMVSSMRRGRHVHDNSNLGRLCLGVRSVDSCNNEESCVFVGFQRTPYLMYGNVVTLYVESFDMLVCGCGE